MLELAPAPSRSKQVVTRESGHTYLFNSFQGQNIIKKVRDPAFGKEQNALSSKQHDICSGKTPRGNSERNSRKHKNMIQVKGGTARSQKMYNLPGQFSRKKPEPKPYFQPYTRINSRGITYFSVKIKV